VVCGPLAGLPAGVDGFEPAELVLRWLQAGDFRGRLAASAAEPAIAWLPLCLVVTGIPWRTTWRYGQRGWRHLFWDAGAIVAAVTLAAQLSLLSAAQRAGELPSATAVTAWRNQATRLRPSMRPRRLRATPRRLALPPDPSPATSFIPPAATLLEHLVAVHAVDRLTPGVHRCSQGDFQLLRAGVERRCTRSLCLGQDLCCDAGQLGPGSTGQTGPCWLAWRGIATWSGATGPTPVSVTGQLWRGRPARWCCSWPGRTQHGITVASTASCAASDTGTGSGQHRVGHPAPRRCCSGTGAVNSLLAAVPAGAGSGCVGHGLLHCGDGVAAAAVGAVGDRGGDTPGLHAWRDTASGGGVGGPASPESPHATRRRPRPVPVGTVRREGRTRC
jgi:hypothetical protein